MSTEPQTLTQQYGAVFEDSSQSVYEDLVGPTYDTLEDATQAILNGRVTGRRGTPVFREGPDAPWLTVYSRQSPVDWVRSRRGTNG